MPVTNTSALKATLVLLMSVASSQAAASPVQQNLGPLALRAWSSAATVLNPEVNVLIRNASDTPQEFLLQFGFDNREGRVTCRQGAPDAHAQPEPLTIDVDRLRRHSRASLAATIGVVPAKGWTHRAFLVGPIGRGPCHVPYRLTLRDESRKERRLEGVVEVPSGLVDRGGKEGASDLDADSVVEIDRSTRQGGAIVRILVENRGAAEITVGIGGVHFECPSGAQPMMELQHTTIQGEEAGPVPLAASGAHVFAIGVQVAEGQPLGECRGTAAIVSFESMGMRVLRQFEFSLQPSGFFDSGAHGFR